jgi:hypothetical protein
MLIEFIGGILNRASVVAAAIAIVSGLPAVAQDSSGPDPVGSGRAFVMKTCSECHVVVPRQFMAPRDTAARDFVDIANDPNTTAMGLLVFLHTPHASMPNLVLTNQESNDVIAYIMSLRKNNGR